MDTAEFVEKIQELLSKEQPFTQDEVWLILGTVIATLLASYSQKFLKGDLFHLTGLADGVLSLVAPEILEMNLLDHESIALTASSLARKCEESLKKLPVSDRDIFLKGLKMLVMPVVLFSITLGAASISPSKLGKIGLKILAYYMLTSMFAITIGLVLGNLSHVGQGFSLPAEYSGDVSHKSVDLLSVLLSMIPSNPFKDLAGSNPLPVITFAIMLGIAISLLRENQEYKEHANLLFRFFEALNQVTFIMIRWVLEFSPLGIMGLIGVTIHQRGIEVLLSFLKLIVVAYLGMSLHIIIIYGGLLKLYGISPVEFFKRIKDVMLMAYATRSSSGVLPLSMKVAHEELRISPSVYSFTLPLGATINMDGTALYIALETMFVANAMGIHLSIAQQLTILITSLLASIGTAGVPSASLILLTVVLQTLNLPLSFIPIFASFDPFCDMMRTMTNVTGDLTGTFIVAKSEGEVETEVTSDG